MMHWVQPLPDKFNQDAFYQIEPIALFNCLVTKVQLEMGNLGKTENYSLVKIVSLVDIFSEPCENSENIQNQVRFTKIYYGGNSDSGNCQRSDLMACMVTLTELLLG